MGVLQQGLCAGGWKGVATAGENLIPTLKDNEKDFAEKSNRNFVEDAFHIADISIEAPAGTTFSINNGTTITMPESELFHCSSTIIKYLIFDKSVEVNLAYSY